MSVSSLTRRASASGVKASSGHSASIIGIVPLLLQVFRCGDNRPLRVHLEVAASPLFEEYQTHTQMITIRIWVYDGILASGVAGPIDVLNAANHLSGKLAARGSKPLPMFAWRVESLDGQPVKAASGHSTPRGRTNPPPQTPT